jgi:hypothetical protein
MEWEFKRLKWVLVLMAILLVTAAYGFLASAPCRVIDGVAHCSFHDRAEDLYQAYKGLIKGW